MNLLLLHRASQQRQLRLTLWVGLALALLLPQQQPQASSNAFGFHQSRLTTFTSSDSAAVPRFRLGTAGRPLGWATAIGDLDVDGTPDVAVADRIAQRTNGYGFRIQFLISGQPTDDVTFDSPNDAVTISLSDVDTDHDLDIVVRASLSNETVGVWLNDGHGRFTSSDIRQLSAALHACQVLGGATPADDASLDDVSPQRAGACADGLLASVVPISCSRLGPIDHPGLPFSLHAAIAGPRAPPLDPAVS